MRTRTIRMLATLGLSVAAVTTGSPASAAPTTAAEFSAALTQAIAESGVLAAGTTLTEEYTSMSGSGQPERIDLSIVNPDGSLIERSGYLDNLTEVRCVRYNRCWQYHHDAFPNRRWRQIARTETAHYSTHSADEFAPSDIDPPAGTTYDITEVAGVGRVFTKVTPVGATDASSFQEYDTYTWIVNGPSLSASWSMTEEQGTREVNRRVLTASPTPTRVTAPTSKALPEFKDVYVSVPINGCGGITHPGICS